MARLITRTMLIDHVKVKFYDEQAESVMTTDLNVPDADGRKDWEKAFHEFYGEETVPVSFSLESQTEELVSMPKIEFYHKGTHKEVVKND